MPLTAEHLDRLAERLERWSGPENPSLPVNYCLELLALARKGLEAERLEREADWLAQICAEHMLDGVDADTIQWWRNKAREAADA